mgnify:CR=1 FL=1
MYETIYQLLLFTTYLLITYLLSHNDDELFYLKTRGLDDGVARNLLNYAFAKEVIDDLPIKSLAGVIESYIKQQTRV